MIAASATEISEENYCAILSEAGGSFDRAFLLRWVAENKEGYFVRDPESPMDCILFTPENFFTLYHFQRGDIGVMFRAVETNGNTRQGETL